MRKGAETRERILEIAEAAVLAKGFGATSIEEVIAEAGITKSGFFYHFKDKNQLARDMMLRYVEENDRIFDDVFHRGRQLSDDPLQSFLITLKLLAEIMRDLPNGHPGCLIATFTYQERLFDRDVRDIANSAVRSWNERFQVALTEIALAYPPREPIDIEDVAEMFSCVVDGGIIMSRALGDPRRLERQIMAFRSFVKLLFTPAGHPATASPNRAAAIA
ncbi:MAG: TetR/AcrR family transcriptional regulator [Pseudaminobacter sp.]|nr:TetR/AcrR family transcriptional regulator [Pseudaminobacter sp.]